MLKRIAGLSLFIAIAAVASAQVLPDAHYEVVLVPVFFSGPGAHGSQWETSVEVTATSEHSITLAKPVVLYEWQSSCGCGCATTDITTRISARICPGFNDVSGILLWVPRTAELNDLHVNARVRDTSQNATSAGTFVPVVRERDLTGEPMVLLDVPTDSRFRTSLRLFEAMFGGGSVWMQIYDMNDYRTGHTQALVEANVELVDPNPRGIVYDPHPLRPSFAFIGDLVAQYPQLANSQSVAIVLQGTQPRTSPPIYPDRYYALASVTNNTTQEVTIIAPR